MALLAKNLEEYLQQGFQFHPTFMEEFKELLYGASGHEKEIFLLLIKQLTFGESGDPIFLAAFFERAGKRASDYTQWKKVLANRYAEMVRGEVLI